MELDLIVNGVPRRMDVPPGTSLLALLRAELGLVGSKEACGRGECGTCTVLIGDRAVMSCVMLAVEVTSDVTTIEGLESSAEDLRESFAEAYGFQCGFCTSGQIVRAESLLRHSAPASLTRPDVLAAIAGNLCRCTGYVQIVDAVELAARRRGLWAVQTTP